MTERTLEIGIGVHNGCLRVFMGRGEPAGELSWFLSATLAKWMKETPGQRIVSVIPINRDGDTVELHTGFESRKGSSA